MKWLLSQIKKIFKSFFKQNLSLKIINILLLVKKLMMFYGCLTSSISLATQGQPNAS
jgi:hypothetical protein